MKTNLSPAKFFVRDISVATTTGLAAPEESNRAYLEIQNLTGGILYVGFGIPATSTSFQIAAGASWSPNTPPLDSINLMAATAGKANVLCGYLSA